MAITGGMSCVKYLLFIFNLLFAVTGLIILIAGIKAEIKAYPYKTITDENFFTSGPVVLMIVGVVIFIIAFFGCCGAVKENHCMIVTFSVFLLIIFIAELAVGIAAYQKRHDLETSIELHLNQTIKEYPTNKAVQDTYDMMQTDFECCGLYSYKDWSANGVPVLPSSCCPAREIINNTTAPCKPETPGFHDKGCLPIVVTYLKDIAVVLGGVGIGIAVIQLLGVIFACGLARSIRNQYETV